MEKIDLKKRYSALYNAPTNDFAIVDVPSLSYFMVDGYGDPNVEPGYREAVEALYTASYTLKFMGKDELGRDYVVPPLQGLWWADDLNDFVSRRKERWHWTMMILTPDFIPFSFAEAALVQAVKKKGSSAQSRVRLATLEEGRSVQTMHVGSYDSEGPILARLHDEFLPSQGLKETGVHHEIYLSDPRRTAPHRLKTILRQPVRPA